MAAQDSLLKRTAQNSFSGTCGGIAVCLVGHPFDTLKVRLQTQSVTNPTYSGVTDCFLKTLKWEGVGGLYKGVGSPLVGQMFFRAIMFTSYYQFSTLIGNYSGTQPGTRLTFNQYFLAGAATGAVAAFVECPIDLFKTKMQIQIIHAKASGQPPAYRNVFHAGYLITKQHGIRGAYQGLSATIMRNIPACAVYFSFFEAGRNYFTPAGGSVADLTVSDLLMSGGLGGFFYWALTYPTDVIKSALQSDDADRSKRRFRGIVQCAKTLYREEGGPKRFLKGLSPCLMRSIPANAAMLMVVEQCRKLFT